MQQGMGSGDLGGFWVWGGSWEVKEKDGTPESVETPGWGAVGAANGGLWGFGAVFGGFWVWVGSCEVKGRDGKPGGVETPRCEELQV